MRRLRAQLAYALTRLAIIIAPKDTPADRVAAFTRIAPGFEHQASQRPLRVHRPGGLSTTHGPPAPWAD